MNDFTYSVTTWTTGERFRTTEFGADRQAAHAEARKQSLLGPRLEASVDRRNGNGELRSVITYRDGAPLSFKDY